MVLLTVLRLFKHIPSDGACKYILKHKSKNMSRIRRGGISIKGIYVSTSPSAPQPCTFDHNQLPLKELLADAVACKGGGSSTNGVETPYKPPPTRCCMRGR